MAKIQSVSLMQNTWFRFSLCHLAVANRGEDAALVPHDGVRAGNRRRRRVRRELVEPKLRALYMYMYMDACIEMGGSEQARDRKRERESESEGEDESEGESERAREKRARERGARESER